jgi:hypothetical protein
MCNLNCEGEIQSNFMRYQSDKTLHTELSILISLIYPLTLLWLSDIIDSYPDKYRYPKKRRLSPGI